MVHYYQADLIIGHDYLKYINDLEREDKTTTFQKVADENQNLKDIIKTQTEIINVN